MKPFKLSIAEPCHENWNAMSAQEKGRHCDKCDKTVVDFSNQTPAQISSYMQNTTEKVCGRFKSNDINRVLIPEKTGSVSKPAAKKWFAWLGVFAFLGFGKKAEACKDHVDSPLKPLQPDQLQIKKGHTYIKGQIKCSKTNKGIAEVEVKVYSRGKVISTTRSFVNGHYFITIPENTIWDFKVDIEYNDVHYYTKVINDLPVLKKEMQLQVAMQQLESYEMVEYTMGKLAVVHCPTFDQPHEINHAIKVEHHMMGGVRYVENVVCEAAYRKPETAIEATSFEAPIDTEIREFNISTYPNPSAGIITIDIENATQVSIQVFDLNGKMIHSVSSQERRNTVDLTEAPNGTYIVRVIDDKTNKSVQKKIIKTN